MKHIVKLPTSDTDIREFVHASYDLKPELLKLDALRWKAAIRSVLRGENILFLGESGCGKTMLAQTMHEVFQRPYFYFNMGATQDPRSTLIGNTHFEQNKGTYVALSLFVQAIQIPNSLILLDELSRAHPEAHNILMTVLDKRQRYLRIDEHPDSPVISVADGVCFMATANVGTEYTATRTMDRALLDRFSILKMEPLSMEDEYDLLTKLFPPTTYPDLPNAMLKAIAEIADSTRQQVKAEIRKIETIISTRMSIRVASLMADGFTLDEALETAVYPFFSNVGQESGLAYMKQLAQQYLTTTDTPDGPAPYTPDNVSGTGTITNPWMN